MTTKKITWTPAMIAAFTDTLAKQREESEHLKYRESQKEEFAAYDARRYSMRATDSKGNRTKMHWGGK